MLPDVFRFQQWLRRKAPHASTALHYGNDLALFFAWLGKKPDEVSFRDVDRFIEFCYAQEHAITTINRRLAALRSFYHFLAVESDGTPANPVLPKRHFIRHGERLPRDVQDSTVEKLFEVISGPRDRTIFLLMLRCGLRVGEVCHLSLGDLYLEPAPGCLPRLWLHGKGDKERIVYLSAQCMAALQVWLAIRPQSREDAVFLNRLGKRLSIPGVQFRLAQYCRQAGVWVTCHQLRHTFGRHMTEARVPLTTIQNLLGHSRLATTEIYLHISSSQIQEDYEKAIQIVLESLPLSQGAQP